MCNLTRAVIGFAAWHIGPSDTDISFLKPFLHSILAQNYINFNKSNYVQNFFTHFFYEKHILNIIEYQATDGH